MKKKPIEMIKNKYTPLIKMEDELSTLVQFQEKIMAEVIDRQDEEYANFLISQITLFMKENNVSICFILNKEELIDCLKEHNKLHYEILNLQSQLDQANERLKGAIELPVKLGDTIYVVPSRTSYQINIIDKKEEKKNLFIDILVDYLQIFSHFFKIDGKTRGGSVARKKEKGHKMRVWIEKYAFMQLQKTR